ncbi:MAG: hypothetical protein ABL907_14605 [Hyphomicrobium sp.]
MNRLLTAFIAGCLATLVFHQSTVAALNALQVMPAGFPPWSFDPVPPLGVPTVISKAFWGGLWAILLDLLLARTSGLTYWGGWTVLGALALSLVAIFVVPQMKGAAMPDFMSRMPIYAMVNGAWGLGTALILRLVRGAG